MLPARRLSGTDEKAFLSVQIKPDADRCFREADVDATIGDIILLGVTD